MKNTLPIYLTVLFGMAVFTSSGQGIQTEFGKNRIQFTRDFDEWVYYESQNFITYWYGEGRMVGQAVVLIAEEEHDGIQRLLEHRMNDKIEIIVYTDLSDLKQSNIGSEEAFTNVTGRTKIIGNRVFVYFDGDHQHLRRQLREGIAGVYIDAILTGSNLQEFVQNAILFHMPEWFREGLIAYAGQSWDTNQDDALRQLFLSKDFKRFSRHSKDDPRLIGHSFWYFIAQQYDPSAIANILYISRIYRDVEEGILYVLGSSLNQLTDSWESFYKQRYESDILHLDARTTDRIPVRNKHQVPLTAFQPGPDRQHVAYVLNNLGKVKVYIQDIKTGKRKKVWRAGFRNAFQATDTGYPLLTWHPGGQILGIVYEKKDKIFLAEINIITGEKLIHELPPMFQRIYSASYFDPQRLLFSAATGGVSDIMIFHLPTRQTERITNDHWDDLDPVPFTFKGKKGILFSSNRPDNSIQPERLNQKVPTGHHDIFFYNYQEKAKEAVRVTKTARSNERNPISIDDKWFAWLSESSGVWNRSIGYLDSVVVRTDSYYLLPDGEIFFIHGDSTHLILPPAEIDTSWQVPIYEVWAYGQPHTNAPSNILLQSTVSGSYKGYDVFNIGKKFEVYPTDLDTTLIKNPWKTALGRQGYLPRRKEVKEIPIIEDVRPKVPDTIHYYFKSKFDYPSIDSNSLVQVPATEVDTIDMMPRDESIGVKDTILPVTSAHQFNSSRIIPSRLRFRLHDITNRFDNSLLFGGLDNFTGRQFLHLDQGNARFTPPPLGFLIKANVKDIFEDYEIEGGMRIPVNFRGSEFFLVLHDKKHRWDKQYGIYRGDWSNIFDINSNVLNGPPHLVPPGLGGPGTPNQYKVRMQTTIGQIQFRYPFDLFRSFRLRTTFRNDRYFWHALEPSTLAFPAVNEQRIGLRAEYVMDNTLAVAPNILNGVRYNIYTEVLKSFQMQVDPWAFDLNKGFTGVVGVDFRYYYPILRYSVMAFRFNGATSFGQQRILYYLGGVDNWLLPQFNQTIPIPDQDYGLQTLAANLRGHEYNIRNGSSFVLANAELRVPIFRHLFPRVRSNFLRNFQVTSFFDAGTAWEGLSPYSDDNPLNILYIENPPAVSMRIKFFRDPLVVGYGVGIRSILFGYMVKVDYAWGIETKVIQKPILHLSLGADF